MEQQTISIAKAGITTILNSRVSVLAAANPVYGRYDDTRTPAENIDFLPTILSRFDLIFIVRDVRDEARDKSIARHVMGIHTSAFASASHRREMAAVERARQLEAGNIADADFGTEIDLKTMTKYVKIRLLCSIFHRIHDQIMRLLWLYLFFKNVKNLFHFQKVHRLLPRALLSAARTGGSGVASESLRLDPLRRSPSLPRRLKLHRSDHSSTARGYRSNFGVACEDDAEPSRDE